MTPAEIAAGLTKAQQNTVLALSDQPALLGCSATCADRLSRPTSRRPALVVRVPVKGDWEHHMLNEAGLAVRAILMEKNDE